MLTGLPRYLDKQQTISLVITAFAGLTGLLLIHRAIKVQVVKNKITTQTSLRLRRSCLNYRHPTGNFRAHESRKLRRIKIVGIYRFIAEALA